MSDPITEALWQKVCDDFTSDKVHEVFITHCRNEGLLPDAARRYRERKDALAEDQEDEHAAIDKRLSAIAILAMSQIELHRTEPKKNYVMLALKIMAAVMALWAVVMLVRALYNLSAATR